MIGLLRFPLTILNGVQLGLIAGLACLATWCVLQGGGNGRDSHAAVTVAARGLAAAIDRGIGDVEADARSAGLLLRHADPALSDSERAQLLRKWLALHPGYADVMLVLPDGVVRAAGTVAVLGRDLSRESWFQRTRRTDVVVSTEHEGFALAVALPTGERVVLRVGGAWFADLETRLRAALPADIPDLALRITGEGGLPLAGPAPASPRARATVEVSTQTAGGRDSVNPGWVVTATASMPQAGLVARPDQTSVGLLLALTLAAGALGYAVASAPARRLRHLANPNGTDDLLSGGVPIAEIDALEQVSAAARLRDGRGLDEARTGIGRLRGRLRTFEAMSGWTLWEIDTATQRVIWSDPGHDPGFAGDNSSDLADLVAGIASDDQAAMRLTMRTALLADGAHDIVLRTVRSEADGSSERRLLVRFLRDRTMAGEASPRLFALSRELVEGATNTPEGATERRQDRVLRQVTDGIVHDFNNVLTVIVASLGSLKHRHSQDQEEARLVDAALTAAARGSSLTRRMVSLVRSETGSLAETDLAATVGAFLPFLQVQVLGETNVMNRLPPGLPTVQCSERIIEIALLNVGFHFRDAGLDGFAVTGSPSTTGPDQGSYVRLVVASGRAQSPTARPFPRPTATGHLDVVARLLERSGGRLCVHSDGTGPEPFLADLWLRSDVSERPVTVMPPVGIRLRVLLVESDSLVRSSLAGALSDLGHTVVQAASGEHALEILAVAEAFDAMIADQSMPVMSGLQLAATVVERHPGVQVIIAGPHGHLPASARRFLQLDKPFRQEDLAAMLYTVAATPFRHAA